MRFRPAFGKIRVDSDLRLQSADRSSEAKKKNPAPRRHPGREK
jgi:hypothetical protein